MVLLFVKFCKKLFLARSEFGPEKAAEVSLRGNRPLQADMERPERRPTL